MLALEKREFVYEFNIKIKELSLHFHLIDYSVEKWSYINKLKELQAESSRHAIIKMKDFIHKNNV